MANPITTFLKEVREELHKVSWLSREEVLRLTAVVLGVSIVLGIYIGGIDFALTKGIEAFLR